MDQQVVDTVRGGLDPLVYISGSVPWARGAAVGLPGTWPSPVRFAQFARAAARRYSGTFTPAGDTAPLPRVRFWQAWNEPNAGRELAPQRVNGRPVSPAHYRRMVNAFADAVHGVRAGNLVVAGSLGPFGHDSKDIQVVAPMTVHEPTAVRLAEAASPEDVLAAHPLRRVGPQPVHERRAEPASAQSRRRVHRRPSGDARAARRGEASRHHRLAASARVLGDRVQLGYQSTRPEGRSVGASRPLGCRGALPDVASRSQRGDLVPAAGRPPPPDALSIRLLHGGGRAKHSLQAFRFPFVAFREGGGVSVWGRTPSGKSGSVIVERRAGRGWVSVARLRADRNGIFSRRLPRSRATTFRARLVSPSESSIPFSLIVPPDRPTTPFGCGGQIPC